MPDLFDDLSPDLPRNIPAATPASELPTASGGASGGDIFDSLDTSPSWARRAGAAIDQRKAAGQSVSPNQNQAIVRMYQEAEGVTQPSEFEMLQSGLKRMEAEQNPVQNAASAFLKSSAQIVPNAVGLVAPETAAGMNRDINAAYGESTGVSGFAGELAGSVLQSAGMAATGPIGVFAGYSALGAGGERADIAERRQQGEEISGLQEGVTAASVGLAEGIFERYLGLPGLKNADEALHAALPGIVEGIKSGSLQTVKQALREAAPSLGKSALKGASEEGLTSLAQDILRVAVSGKDMSVGEILQNAAMSGAMGAIAEPLGGAVMHAASDGGTETAPTAAPSAEPKLPFAERVAETILPKIKERRESAERAADTDPLTGVGNRRALDRALPAAEADPDTSVISFDANNFGKVNKIKGEAAGDEMLKQLTGAVQEAAKEVGPTARVFRKGGDEIVVLAPKGVAEQVRARAEEIFGENEVSGDYEGKPLSAKISLSGVVGSTFDEANAKLQEAKAIRKGTLKPTVTEMASEQPKADQMAGAAQTPLKDMGNANSEFSREEVARYIGSMEGAGSDTLVNTLSDEPHVLVEVPVDKLTTMSEEIDPAKMEDAEDFLDAKSTPPPVVVGNDLTVIDGAHRTLAARNRGVKTIGAVMSKSQAEKLGLTPVQVRSAPTATTTTEEKPAVTMAAFRKKGPGHTKVLVDLQKLMRDGTLHRETVDVILDVLHHTNDSFLARFPSIKSNGRFGVGHLGRAGSDRTPLSLQKGLDLTTSLGIMTFLHEYAHTAGYYLLSPEEKQTVRRVFMDMGRTKRKAFFDQGVRPLNRDYYAKNPDEFFAQSFAEWVLAERVPDRSLIPLVKKVGKKLMEAIDRLRGRPSIKPLIPLYERLLAGVQMRADNPKGFIGKASVADQSPKDAKTPSDIAAVNQDTLGFVSKLEQVISEKMTGPMPSSQIMATVKAAGVKEDEIWWSGLEDFLRDDRKITPAEMRIFLDISRLILKETVKGEPTEDKSVAEATTRVDQAVVSLRNEVEQVFGGNSVASARFMRDAGDPDATLSNLLFYDAETQPFADEGPIKYPRLAAAYYAYRASLTHQYEVLHTADRSTTAQYGQYTVPGGQHYREILLQVPSGVNLFQSSHFSEKNIVAHLRTTERQTADKKTTLFLEELQSDWHQKGRERGYAGPERDVQIKSATQEIDAKIAALRERYWTDTRTQEYQTLQAEFANSSAAEIRETAAQSEQGNMAARARRDNRHRLGMLTTAAKGPAYDDTIIHMSSSIGDPVAGNEIMRMRDALRELKITSPIPRGPFAKTWHEMAFRRAVRLAAEQGHDSVSWTTGQEQADRYDLSTQLYGIRVKRHGESGFLLEGWQTRGSLNFNPDFSQSVTSEAALVDLIGKSLATAAVEKLNNDQPASFSGTELSVGGEGMKTFYDRILPQYANKLAKKFGGRVTTEFVTGADQTHVLRITDTMRESVLGEGQHLFEIMGPTTRKTLLATSNPVTGQHSRLIGRALEDWITPISSRIQDLSPKIFNRLKQMTFAANTASERLKKELHQKAVDITKALGGPKTAEYKKWKQAVLNKDQTAATALLPAHLQSDFREFYTTFRNLYDNMIAAGVKVGDEGTDYWPRSLRDYSKFAERFGGDEGRFEDAFEQAQAFKGQKTLSNSEKADIANMVLQGFGPVKPGKFGPPLARTRTVDDVEADMVDLYADPFDSAFRYIDNAAYSAERARFFGKGPDPHNLDESVGPIVQKEVDAGKLNKDQQNELHDLLKSRFTADMLSTSKGVKRAKEIIYLSTLGQFRSAITQFTDVAMTAAAYGLKNTATGVRLSVGRNRQRAGGLMREDLGIHQHGEEFRDVSAVGKTLNRVLEATGFMRLDRFGKEVRANAAVQYAAKAALNPKSKAFDRLRRDYSPILGAQEFKATMDDLADGKKTERVKYLAFLEVSKVQPISLEDMPKKYLDMPNGRILYTLKTFQVKQLDYVRRDMMRKLRQPALFREGLRDLAAYALWFGIVGFGIDALKGWIKGQAFTADSIPDRVVDSTLNMVGLSRYNAERLLEDPVGATWDYLAPAHGLITDTFADTRNTLKGKIGESGVKSVKYIPVVGELIYYHSPFGAGALKNAKEPDRRFNRMLKDQREAAQAALLSDDRPGCRAILRQYNQARQDHYRAAMDQWRADGRKGEKPKGPPQATTIPDVMNWKED